MAVLNVNKAQFIRSAAAPEQLIDIARIFRFTSADSPFADGSPPSTSDQNSGSSFDRP